MRWAGAARRRRRGAATPRAPAWAGARGVRALARSTRLLPAARLHRREEVLDQARAERAARGEAKRRHKAAVALSAGWRGARSRLELRRALLREWQARFAGAAAQPDCQLPLAQLRAAVRLMLAGVGLAPGCARAAQLLGSGQPLRLPAGDGGAASARGTLALVLRSVGAVTDAQQQDAAARVQVLQLAQACCLVAAADAAAPNPVLDAAASRLVQLLATSSQTVQGGLLAQPAPLLEAARRCSLQLQQQRQQPQQEQVGGLTAASALDAALQRLVSVVVLLLEQQGSQHQQQFRQRVVLVLLTTPGLIASLAAASRVRHALQRLGARPTQQPSPPLVTARCCSAAAAAAARRPACCSGPCSCRRQSWPAPVCSQARRLLTAWPTWRSC